MELVSRDALRLGPDKRRGLASFPVVLPPPAVAAEPTQPDSSSDRTPKRRRLRKGAIYFGSFDKMLAAARVEPVPRAMKLTCIGVGSPDGVQRRERPLDGDQAGDDSAGARASLGVRGGRSVPLARSQCSTLRGLAPPP